MLKKIDNLNKAQKVLLKDIKNEYKFLDIHSLLRLRDKVDNYLRLEKEKILS